VRRPGLGHHRHKERSYDEHVALSVSSSLTHSSGLASCSMHQLTKFGNNLASQRNESALASCCHQHPLIIQFGCRCASVWHQIGISSASTWRHLAFNWSCNNLASAWPRFGRSAESTWHQLSTNSGHKLTRRRCSSTGLAQHSIYVAGEAPGSGAAVGPGTPAPVYFGITVCTGVPLLAHHLGTCCQVCTSCVPDASACKQSGAHMRHISSLAHCQRLGVTLVGFHTSWPANTPQRIHDCRLG
jgi:hypothetical protein